MMSPRQKLKGRSLRYADGGMTPVAGMPQSAFNQMNPSYGGSDTGLNNNAPLVAITNAPVGGPGEPAMRKGGKVKKMAKGGASKRGDGCAVRGKTKGRMV
jgi:hypothetical protein